MISINNASCIAHGNFNTGRLKSVICLQYLAVVI